jgi:hypothetical protein
MVLFHRICTIEIPDREKSYGRVIPRIRRVIRAHSTMVYGERRLEKRTVSRSVMIGEKVEKVRWDLGRAKRVRSRVRAAIWAVVWGEREGVDEVQVGFRDWESGELWFPFAGWC